MSRTWFPDRDYAAIEIKLFDYTVDGRAPVRVVRIGEQEAIKKIVYRIEQLPADGPEFRSFVPKEVIEMSFVSGQAKQVVRIYDGQFKTPSTGFNTSSEARKLETPIYKDIRCLLEVKTNCGLLMIKEHEYIFPDFSVVYKGKERYDYSPITVSGQDEIFIIKSKEGEQKAVISSGQLPPQPHPFTIGNKTFILQTYRTSKGESLPPDTFLIEQAP